MQIHSAMLISDWLIWGLLTITLITAAYMSTQPHLREPWHRVFSRPANMVTFVVLMLFATIGLLASTHLEVTHTDRLNGFKTSEVKTVLDILITPLGQQDEKSYSAPLATKLYGVGEQPRLRFGGAHLQHPEQKTEDIVFRVFKGVISGTLLFAVFISVFCLIAALVSRRSWRQCFSVLMRGETLLAWRAALMTLFAIVILIAVIAQLATHYHLLGTNKIGHDVFYEALISVRTGLLIGTLTTIFMLPLALIFGTVAGFFGGVIDDLIQYLYTTLSSIPGVLLISASILVMQVYIANHPHLFPTLLQRADARLLALCLILGITSWAGLCRLLRAETLKLRELEYIQAAKAFGVGKLTTIVRHILPNVMHIVLITIVLDFSGLVLAEAVLSYVGVGVDPTTASWGNIINSSRMELAREPFVWWPLIAALIFMFSLVLSANLFADAVRDAFDPRLRER